MALLFEAAEPVGQVMARFNRHDEDGIDKLNHRYSFLLFVVLAITVTTNQYVGDVIKCWSPAQYPESWVEYTHSLCWISNTYYVPMEENNILVAPRKEIAYYQWVPLVLLLQAILFYIPGVFWFVYSRSTGFDINKIVASIRQIEAINPENRDKTTKFLVKHIHRSIQVAKNMPRGRCLGCKRIFSRLGILFGRRYGNYLMAAYVFMKLLNIANAILQLYMLNVFLGTNFTFYGFEALQELKNTGEYRESARFPRVTLCDFTERKLGRSARITIQCTLPINLFNEKVFTLVWFWLAFMFIINLVSLFSWLSTVCPQTRIGFVKRYLKVFDRYNRTNPGDKVALVAFCDKYLRMDGYFALQMIRHNTNEVVIGELIAGLWDNFKKQYDVEKQSKSLSSLSTDQ